MNLLMCVETYIVHFNNLSVKEFGKVSICVENELYFLFSNHCNFLLSFGHKISR